MRTSSRFAPLRQPPTSLDDLPRLAAGEETGPARQRPRGGWRRLGGLLTAAAAFAALAALVSAGKLASVDSYSVRHLMPWFPLNEQGKSFLGTLLSHRGLQFHATKVVAVPVTFGAACGLAVALSAILFYQGHKRAAGLWLLAFIVGNGVELLCKNVIVRPPLSAGPGGSSIHISGFDSSFPSGHVIRAVILIAILVELLPVARWALIAWLGALVLVLELNGMHTPSDIAGGLLLGVALVGGVSASRELLRRHFHADTGSPATASRLLTNDLESTS